MCRRGSVLVVLERDTLLGEVVADAVRLRPVFRRAGGIAGRRATMKQMLRSLTTDLIVGSFRMIDPHKI